jgi:hypothetical protein
MQAAEPETSSQDNGALISGELAPADKETVAAMKRRFHDKINRLVQEAAGPNAPQDMLRACWSYCYIASKARALPKAAALKELAAQGADAVIAARKAIRGDITTSLAKEIINKAAEERKIPLARKFLQQTRALLAATTGGLESQAAAVQRVFGDEDRIYFQLRDGSRSPAQGEIEAFLAAKGYSDIDYRGGFATDSRKNRCKIGKLLKDEPGLSRAFVDDPVRHGKNLMVVLSRHPYDVARGSYGRGWQSCRTSRHSVSSTGGAEAAAGVLAAYLVREDDPNIHDPLARVFLKPYYGTAKDEDNASLGASFVYMSFNPIGLHYPAFLDAVNRFAETNFNTGKHGEFKLHDKCEAYREFRRRTRLPEDAEKALRMLGVRFRKSSAGFLGRGEKTLHVDGDLSVSGLGLTRLPDFRKVKVSGIFNCAENKLTSLAGTPEAAPKVLDCSQNLLLDFSTCTTPQATEQVRYNHNPFLVSLAGLPKAPSYAYGNTGYDEPKVGTVPVSPLDQPGLFPGFKRS